MPEFGIITGRQVREVLDSDRNSVIDLIARTYREHGLGRTVNPSSHFLRFPDRPDSRIIALPASLMGSEGTEGAGRVEAVDGIKWISSFPGNVNKGLPRASAVLILNDPATGFPMVCMEASVISATRTAASAALAADWLTRRRGRPRRIGFFGAGLIARYTHTYLADAGWKFEEVGVHDVVDAHAKDFSDYLCGSGREQPESIRIHRRAEDLVKASDMVVFATVAGSPHISDPSWFEHAPLVIHLSLRDLAPEILLGAFNVVDDVEHCLTAGTSPHLAEQSSGGREFLHGTLTDVMSGALEVPADRTIIFSPFGLGVLDVAVGRYVLERVRATDGLAIVEDFFSELRRYG